MASHKLPLKTLSIGVQEFNYHLDAAFFNDVEATDVREASVDAVVKVDRKDDEIYQLSFEFSGEITIPCDRCLDDMQLPVATTYNLTVKEGEEYDDSDDEVLVIPGHWRELDLTPLMRDTVLLTIPIMHAHPEGECNPQMLDRLEQIRAVNITDDEQLYDPEAGVDNEETTNNSSDDIDPRWAALKKLKDNN
ncbi:MAG: DUF177 domain-containing protein [Muribaculaceae bacterium]|nr:DUF177 domain-containing protein [Muribaculaceae bacterium]